MVCCLSFFKLGLFICKNKKKGNDKMVKKSKWGILVLLTMLISAIVMGCSTDSGKDDKKEEPKTSQKSEFPVTIKDGTDKEITIKEEPKTIVSLLPSNTEIAYSLGLGDKIIGVSDYDNYPKETKDKPKLGGLEINVEKVLELNPDLALLSATTYKNSKETIEQFKKAGIDVVIVPDSNSFEDAYDTINLIAKATGTTDKADSIIQDMKKEVAEIKESVKGIKDKKSVWLEVSSAPDLYTTGKNTFLNEMLEILNAENIAADQTGWVNMNEEMVVKRNPDVIITTYGYYIDNPEEKVYARKGWSNVTAVKEKQVYDIDNDTVSRPGPRLVDGLKSLGEKIYPDIFNK